MHLVWASDVIERFGDGWVDPLIDTVYPRRIGVCAGVILIFHSQIEWIRMRCDIAYHSVLQFFWVSSLARVCDGTALTLATVLSCILKVCVTVRFPKMRSIVAESAPVTDHGWSVFTSCPAMFENTFLPGLKPITDGQLYHLCGFGGVCGG